VSRPTRATRGINDESSSPTPRRPCARASPSLATHAPLRDPADHRRRSRRHDRRSTPRFGRTVTVRGALLVGHGSRVEDGSILVDTGWGAGARTCAGPTALERGVMSRRAVIGPSRGLRPGTQIGPEAHAQLRRAQETVLGRQQGQPPRVLGDAINRAKVNVVAGHDHLQLTNGYENRQTSSRTAPSSLRTAISCGPCASARRAVVRRGHDVTRDVPAGALAIARAEQQAKPATRRRRRALRYAARPREALGQ